MLNYEEEKRIEEMKKNELLDKVKKYKSEIPYLKDMTEEELLKLYEQGGSICDKHKSDLGYPLQVRIQNNNSNRTYQVGVYGLGLQEYDGEEYEEYFVYLLGHVESDKFYATDFSTYTNYKENGGKLESFQPNKEKAKEDEEYER